MTRALMYVVLGYLGGSILFARVLGQLFYRRDVTEDGPDSNPGTYNAFKCGGFVMGVLTLIFDIAKGVVPVYLFIHYADEPETGLALALVMSAPVIGHAFPIFYKFRGGKGIAVTFGTLLGLFPDVLPVLFLAAAFIFYSSVIKISPNCYRTIAAFSSAGVLIPVFSGCPIAVAVGFLISSVCVNIRLYRSTEQKQSLEVKPAWKH